MKADRFQQEALSARLRSTAYCVQVQDLTRAARVMAAAFGGDPSIRYLLGGTSEGPNDWRYFLTVLRAVYDKCCLLSSDADVQDLLVLFPPTLQSVPTLRFFWNGGLRLCRFFGPGLLLRSLRYERNCQRIKARLLPPTAWYCMCFVVLPERQGRGAGSRLIRPVLRSLDEQQVPLYLETHREVNTQIYKHLGFRLADVSVIPGTAITQYGMLRDPERA